MTSLTEIIFCTILGIITKNALLYVISYFGSAFYNRRFMGCFKTYWQNIPLDLLLIFLINNTLKRAVMSILKPWFDSSTIDENGEEFYFFGEVQLWKKLGRLILFRGH